MTFHSYVICIKKFTSMTFSYAALLFYKIFVTLNKIFQYISFFNKK
ncbi:hypothetical protein HMPREF3182_01465 [Megasphaera hutchinsoni]|uniref:Uncharacterized protein n=1 Tax=Megasphaera hutchinsoni TaxID=1588748 RepID=A0A134CD51_9FIRM|nr:hypothetical protein HMPREF3182_01465 [Megasphaera hutchinsoni]